ncbi:MAG: outer membrane beta-barrel protein [Pseudomonadota bacterium]
MKRLTSLFAVAAAATTLTFANFGSALADGHTSLKDEPPRRVSAPWSGLYVGVQGGWLGSEADWTFDNVAQSPTPNPLDFDSGLFGGILGYQHQFGPVVIGIEGTFSGTIGDEGSATCPNAAFTCTADVNSIATVGGRFGFAFGTTAMLYFTGGYANADVSTNTTNGVLVDPVSERVDGHYLGGGLEFMTFRNLVFGIEYRHYDFDTADLNSGRVPGTDDRIVDLDSDSVTARLTFLLK